jgi:hypothetical protein
MGLDASSMIDHYVNLSGKTTPADSALVEVGISPHFHNKDNIAELRENSRGELSNKRAYGHFVAHCLTITQLREHITRGGAFTPGVFKGDYRKKGNFVKAQILVLDIDNTNDAKDDSKRRDYISIDRVIAHPFVQQYAAIVFPTASSTPEWHKVRVVFVLSESVEGSKRWETLQKAILIECADLNPDPHCSDAARMLYGSTNPVVIFRPDVRLPIAVAAELTSPLAQDDNIKLHTYTSTKKIALSSDRAEKYARITYDKTLQALICTCTNRNNALYVAGKRMFGCCLGGWPGFDETTIKQDLLDACERNGYIAKDGEHAARATIASALRSSVAIPLELSHSQTRNVSEKHRNREAVGNKKIASPHENAEVTQISISRETTYHFSGNLPDSWIAAANVANINVAIFHLLYWSAWQRNTHRITIAELLEDNSQRHCMSQSGLYKFVKDFDGLLFRRLTPIRHDNEVKARKESNVIELLPLTQVADYLMRALRVRLTEQMYGKDQATEPIFTPAMLSTSIGNIDEVSSLTTSLQEKVNHHLTAVEHKEQKIIARHLEAAMKDWHQRLNDHGATLLPENMPINNPSNLTLALAQAIFPIDTPVSNRYLQKLFGVSRNTVRSIAKKLRLVGEQQKIDDKSVKNVIEAKAHARLHGAVIRGFVSIADDGATASHYGFNTESPKFITDHIKAGETVFVQVSAPNIYRHLSSPHKDQESSHVKKPRRVRLNKNEPNTSKMFDADYLPHEHNPRWVYYQLQRTLRRISGDRYLWKNGDLIDRVDGQLYNSPTVSHLIDFILQREELQRQSGYEYGGYMLLHYAHSELGAEISPMITAPG